MSADMPKMPEPFGYWHEGETYEESEFFLASEFGNVGCDRCTGLYTAEDLEKAKQEAARQAMELAVVCKYLPPDGIDAKEALSRIIAIVDPWPLGGNERGR